MQHAKSKIPLYDEKVATSNEIRNGSYYSQFETETNSCLNICRHVSVRNVTHHDSMLSPSQEHCH